MAIWRFFKKKRLGVCLAIAVFVLAIAYIAHLFLTLPDVSGLKTHNPKKTALMAIPFQKHNGW